jgi:hypothetical protein
MSPANPVHVSGDPVHVSGEPPTCFYCWPSFVGRDFAILYRISCSGLSWRSSMDISDRTEYQQSAEHLRRAVQFPGDGRRWRRLVVMSAVSALVTSSLLAPAAATTRTANTRLRLTVSSRHVHVGHRVKLTIHLRSSWSTCQAGQSVKLYRDGVYRSTHTTDQEGLVTIVRHPTRTHSYRARYPGRHFGTYPDRFTCYPSRSRIRTVVVGHL